VGGGKDSFMPRNKMLSQNKSNFSSIPQIAVEESASNTNGEGSGNYRTNKSS